MLLAILLTASRTAAAKLRLGRIPTPRSLGGSDEEAACTRLRAPGAGKSTPKGPAPGAAAMDTSVLPATSLKAVSLQDYEDLVRLREAFVEFLLSEPRAAA